jgi:hypothetical protein
MYLIKSIEINNKGLSKYSDIKNLILENNVCIKINNKYNYKFTNINVDGKNIIKINFI